jgi:hypothetical protein
MNRLISFLIICFLSAFKAQAQVNSYSFWSYWGTYTEISGGTLLGIGTALDDNNFNANEIGFAFTFNGTAYTQFSLNTNGFIALGSSVSSSYAAISTGATNNIIAANNHNLQGNTDASIRYELYGEPGNRVLAIQWKDFKHYNNTSGDHYNFQVRLYETTNEICLVYGDFLTNSTQTAQVGLRGASNTDFANRLTTNNWANTTTGVTNTAVCYLGVTTLPAYGLTYCFNPSTPGNPGLPVNPGPPNSAFNMQNDGSLGWNFGANTSTFDLWFGPKGNMAKVIDYQPALSGSNSYTYQGLSASTNYQWKVVEHNASGSLSGPTWNFTTSCDAFSIPFVESFDSYSPPAVGCGTILNANGDAVKWETKTGLTYSGFNRLHIGYNPPGQSHNDWYFTPGLALTGMQTYEVRFYYKGGSSVYFENLEVKWGDAPTVTGMSSPAIFGDLSFYKANYTQATASFTPPSTGTYFVGWHCFSPGDQISVEVDQITITVTSSCAAPLAISTDSITSSSADIVWSGPALDVRIQYGQAGFILGSNTGTTVSTNINGYTLPGLQASTTYDVYVQQNCGSGTYSPFTGPASFTTLAPGNRTLNLKLYLQALYAGPGTMNQAQDVDAEFNSWNKFLGTIVDTLSVLLRNATDPWSISYEAHGVNISTDGTMTITGIPAGLSGNYYIVIKHRSSVETWSADPVSFSGSAVSYNFSTAATQAYGSTQVNLNPSGAAVWGLYSGDVDGTEPGIQDGYIEFFDLNSIYNGTLSETFYGYQNGDLNGDGFVEFLDLNLVYNNGILNRYMNNPIAPLGKHLGARK